MSGQYYMAFCWWGAFCVNAPTHSEGAVSLLVDNATMVVAYASTCHLHPLPNMWGLNKLVAT
jgi:hypothetical protein